MEMVDFWAVLTNEWAQAKFVHTVAGGYRTGAIFVMAISAYYMLRRQDLQFARSSFRLAAVFGMIATLMTIQTVSYTHLLFDDEPVPAEGRDASEEARLRALIRGWKGSRADLAAHLGVSERTRCV